MSPNDIERPRNASTANSSTRENTYPTRDGASIDPAPIDDDLDEKEATVAPRTLSWEEMVEILKQVPYFTDTKPPSTKMSDFFLLMKRISMNLDRNPPISILA